MDAIGELRRLNFADLLVLDHPNVADYHYADYRANSYRHPKILAYCIECERKGCQVSVEDPAFTLKNISHGAHTVDFLAALPEQIDVSGWHGEPVLFVYETPSRDYGAYETVEFDGIRKRPAREWYWIHEDQKVCRFPEAFKGGMYGSFVLSAILTFRLKNVYVTNLVKCGLNTDDGRKFRGLQSFQPTCVQACIEKYLRREVEVFRPKVVIAFGAAVHNWVSALKPSIPVHQLPHPARWGFKHSYFRVLYFWLLALALHLAGIIQTDEAEELGRSFIRDYIEP
ncbi:MAG TPA: uracil-DNA glycosylase family protein [Bryobacteraceae bacterium]|nr:uracil-DNA glycosylase family protein [Bryobacteraceae bacterium]